MMDNTHRCRIDNFAVAFDVDNDNPNISSANKIVKICNNEQNNNNKIKIDATRNKKRVITIL